MSITDTFFQTAKDMLMMTENIKRLDAHVDRLASDMSDLDRRLMRIEIMIDLSRPSRGGSTPAPRKRALKELP